MLTFPSAASPPPDEFHSGIHRVICDWWRCCKNRGEPEHAWEYLFGEGVIDGAEGYAWRGEVFGVDRDDRMVDEEE
jgi:hypothetical protein